MKTTEVTYVDKCELGLRNEIRQAYCSLRGEMEKRKSRKVAGPEISLTKATSRKNQPRGFYDDITRLTIRFVTLAACNFPPTNRDFNIVNRLICLDTLLNLTAKKVANACFFTFSLLIHCVNTKTY